MRTYYLAVDIGASSGRHIIGWLEDGTIKLEEIHRFENGMKQREGSLCWDVEQLFQEIINGMKKCAEKGMIPVSVGIDTWAVDYVLLDSDEKILGNTYGYRDKRTQGMDEKVYEIIPETSLYKRAGIQKQMFNTIYQLMAHKVQEKELLDRAETMLLIPDYFHYRLCGVKAAEYTNVSTTQLMNPLTGDWDWELIEELGYPKRIFQKVTAPGTVLGQLLPEIQEEVGFNCNVVLPGTHDTASAVVSVPSNLEHPLYISSGTWSLMGTEREEADGTMMSQEMNFTSEGGYNKRFRFLKNIMGLWMIQSLRHELDDKYSFAELCSMAEEEKNFPSRVDVNDQCFMAPDSMTDAIKDYCMQSKQQVPETVGELSTVIYQSLAECYAATILEIENITGMHFDCIHVIGGGANAGYLNELTAKYTERTVYAGPTEATAIGNILVQMITGGWFKNLADARDCVFKSFEIKKF